MLISSQKMLISLSQNIFIRIPISLYLHYQINYNTLLIIAHY
jgi:hypothetical protein